MTGHVAGATPRVPRGTVRAWAEARGLVGGQTVAHTTVHLTTRDGTALHADLLPGPDDAGARGRASGDAVVLLHGFAAHARKPAYARLAAALAQQHTVLAPDLRGHGRSGGRSGLGGDEVADVAAAVAWLRARGHRRVALVGVSMGGTATANALGAGVAVDAAVLVSAPGWLETTPSTAPMRRLHLLWQHAAGRLGLQLLLGVRVVRPDRWRRPDDPATALRAWPGPSLVVHGDDDPYFGTAHARALVRAASGPSTLWLEPGFGHAEDGLHGDVLARLTHAVTDLLDTAAAPTPEDATWRA